MNYTDDHYFINMGGPTLGIYYISRCKFCDQVCWSNGIDNLITNDIIKCLSGAEKTIKEIIE